MHPAASIASTPKLRAIALGIRRGLALVREERVIRGVRPDGVLVFIASADSIAGAWHRALEVLEAAETT